MLGRWGWGEGDKWEAKKRRNNSDVYVNCFIRLLVLHFESLFSPTLSLTIPDNVTPFLFSPSILSFLSLPSFLPSFLLPSLPPSFSVTVSLYLSVSLSASVSERKGFHMCREVHVLQGVHQCQSCHCMAGRLGRIASPPLPQLSPRKTFVPSRWVIRRLWPEATFLFLEKGDTENSYT